MTRATRFPAMAQLRFDLARRAPMHPRGSSSLGARALAVVLVLAATLPAAAGLLAEGQTVRVLPFTLRDGDKPMIDATVAGKKGVMLIDNGTPDALFINRAAVPLPQGQWVAKGFAASGQAVEVHSHPTPSIQIHGQPLALPARIRSGDFGFTAPGLGDDFLGFVGTKMLAEDAFVLDYARRQLVLLKVRQDGTLALAPNGAADVLVQTRFMRWPDRLPTFVGAIGVLPMLMDIDTGDGGTLYVTAATREQLKKERFLQAAGTAWQLSGLSIGGVKFEPTQLRLVEAGGPQDFRTEGRVDQLRLGAAFLARHTCLWNFPAKTLTFLQPGAPFLDQFAPARSTPP